MKKLFYNPIEIPEKAHIVSKCLGVDKEYETHNSDCPVYIDDLFKLAKLEVFDEVAVYLTSHNGAYSRDKVNAPRFPLTGWVSLKEFRSAQGYLEDKSLIG